MMPSLVWARGFWRRSRYPPFLLILEAPRSGEVFRCPWVLFFGCPLSVDSCCRESTSYSSQCYQGRFFGFAGGGGSFSMHPYCSLPASNWSVQFAASITRYSQITLHGGLRRPSTLPSILHTRLRRW